MKVVSMDKLSPFCFHPTVAMAKSLKAGKKSFS